MLLQEISPWRKYNSGLKTQLNTQVFCLTQEIGTDFPRWGSLLSFHDHVE